MSADNWAICPRCLLDAEARLLNLQRQVTEGYGVLPVEEWDALRALANEGIDHDALTTFRENYEIYGAKTGVVSVSYSGNCNTCGTNLDFEKKIPIPGVST